jgi:DNA polymerase-3 subunit gamma/tau
VIEAIRTLLERGREPGAVLQGLAGMLRDLVLAGVAPERLELTSVSPQLRPELPELARRIGKARLLHWQAQLKGSEQQLRHSVQPRLWLEVLVLGLLAEPATPAPARGDVPATDRKAEPLSPVPTAAAGSPAPPATPAPAGGATPPVPAAAATDNLAELWQQILAGLELPSTRMLLSQQAQLLRLDERRAVVRVAGTWMAMVQSRLPLLEKAVAGALGSPRQVTLEAGGDAPPASQAGGRQPAPVASSTPSPPPPPPPSTEPQGARPPADGQAAPSVSEASGPAVVQRQLNPTSQPGAAPPAPAQPGRPSPIDEQARRLADFFNGEVVSDVAGDSV